MPYPIVDIEGIGETYGARLKEQGVHTTGDLLRHCADKAGRQQMSQATHIPESLILTWTNHADLMRIKGVAGQYSELLEAAGVDSVAELKLRNAASLHNRLQEVNDQYGLVGHLPSLHDVTAMIAEAQHLPAVVQH